MTTFVYGDAYQDYIPLFAKSINMSYPDYDIRVYVYGPLKDSIKRMIENENINIDIIEHCFDYVANMSPLIAKSLRWVLYDASFLDYDGVYILDIDMIYIREDVGLLEQHLRHCEVLGLPFSNVLRQVNWNKKSLFSFAQRFKRVGIIGMVKYVFQDRNEMKATGLHFIKPNEYYSKITPEVLKDFELNIISKRIFRRISVPNNEVLLWYLLSQHFDLKSMCTSAEDQDLLDSNGFNKPCFRPHHGIHLGNFRIISKTNTIEDWQSSIFNSPQYRNYFKYIRKSELLGVLSRLSLRLGGGVRLQFEALLKVCSLELNE